MTALNSTTPAQQINKMNAPLEVKVANLEYLVKALIAKSNEEAYKKGYIAEGIAALQTNDKGE